MRRRLAAVTAAAAWALTVPVAAIPVPGAPDCPILPSDNVWHSDITSLPVHSRSDAWIASMGGPSRRLHPDFGPSFGEQSIPYGMPYTVVDSSHGKVAVEFEYADESDPGPYPFGPDTPIEGGHESTGDRHALMLERDTCTLYELFAARYSSSGSIAGSGAIFDLHSHALRPDTWTSADAAGLPILPGLVRLDEVNAGVVDHAIRVTASQTDRSYVWPARHQAGDRNDPNLPPMGARFRLKSSFDISGFRADTQVVLRAMQRHGMIVADKGSDWYFTGTAEDGWPEDMLSELKTVAAGYFEAVDASSLMVDPNSGQVRASAPYEGVDLPAEELLFAEGTTRPGFQEYITIANPSSSADAVIDLEYAFTGEPPLTLRRTVPRGTRMTVDVNRDVGAGRDVSVRIKPVSGPGVVAERPMYFRTTVAGLAVDGGHDAAAVSGPAARWFFAEGTTRPGFQQYLALLNPSATDASQVRVRYQGGGGDETVITVPPSSRTTVDVNAVVGSGRDVSADVEVINGPDVVAERPLYFNSDPVLGSPVAGGTVTPGALAPASAWYFAEGTTRTGFRQFITIQNASTIETSAVRIEYQGSSAVSELMVPPSSRQTIDVNAVVGPERDVSAVVRVTSGPGVVAERPIYFSRSLVPGAVVRGGHVSLGAAGPASRWFLAEGTTRPGFAEYVTVQNPTTTPAPITVAYLFPPEQGSPVVLTYQVAAGSRFTIDVRAAAGTGKDVSISVDAGDGGAVVERPVYFHADPGSGLVDAGTVVGGRPVDVS